MTNRANHHGPPVDATNPTIPRWVKILRWVNIGALLLWLGLVVVAFASASMSSTISDSAFGLSVLLVAPLLIAGRFTIAVGLLVLLLIVGTVLMVIYRRRGMTVSQATSRYTLVAWTTFWVVMWGWTLVRMLIG